MNGIRTTKIDGQEFVTLTDYLRLKEEKQELEYLWDINEELKEENKRLRKENKKSENKLSKLCQRIYENIDKKKRKEYQEFCNRHKI